MPLRVALYNNPAGRLHSVLGSLAELNRQTVKLQRFAQQLNISADWNAVMRMAIDLNNEFSSLQSLVSDIKSSNQSKFELYSKNLDDIQKSLGGLVFNMSSDTCMVAIIPSALVALEFMATDLPMEEKTTDGELEALRKLCDELRNEILDASEIPSVLKEWLLDLVRLMRDAIDRYAIRGGKGLRRQLHEIIGSIVSNPDLAKDANKAKPSIWNKILSGMTAMNTMARCGETGMKALEYGKQYLDLFSDTNATPPMLS